MLKIALLFLIFLVSPLHADSFHSDSLHSDSYRGLVRSVSEIAVKAKSQGEIETFFFDEGQVVNKGDVIAVIDDEQERIEWNTAKTNFDVAKDKYEKNGQLKNVISDQEIEDSRINYLKMKDQLDLKAYSLKSTKVITPIAGVITKRLKQTGETVATGDDIVNVVALGKLTVELNIPFEKAALREKGQLVRVALESDKSKSYEGRITFISPVVDSASGTMTIKIHFDNSTKSGKGYDIKPGVLGEVSFEKSVVEVSKRK